MCLLYLFDTFFCGQLKIERFLPTSADVLEGRALISAHRNLQDRLKAAEQFVRDKKLQGDVVIDSMGGEVNKCMCRCVNVL
jgi:hypothetical protein